MWTLLGWNQHSIKWLYRESRKPDCNTFAISSIASRLSSWLFNFQPQALAPSPPCCASLGSWSLNIFLNVALPSGDVHHFPFKWSHIIVSPPSRTPRLWITCATLYFHTCPTHKSIALWIQSLTCYPVVSANSTIICLPRYPLSMTTSLLFIPSTSRNPPHSIHVISRCIHSVAKKDPFLKEIRFSNSISRSDLTSQFHKAISRSNATKRFYEAIP